jgi:hypothetical protein
MAAANPPNPDLSPGNHSTKGPRMISNESRSTTYNTRGLINTIPMGRNLKNTSGRNDAERILIKI